MKNRALKTVPWLLFAFAGAGYLIQCFTPLRFTTDAIIYLSMASAASRGQGFTFHGVSAGYPLGYPMLILALKKAGAGNSLFLNFVNLLAVAIVLLALRTLARARGVEPGKIRAAALACLFSFVLVKHAAIPLTDVIFMALTTSALATADVAARIIGLKAAVLWASSILLAILGITFRIVGVVTVPVVLFELWITDFRRTGTLSAKTGLISGTLAVGILFGAFHWAFSQPAAGTGSRVSAHLGRLVDRPILEVIGPHVLELGELGLNIPESRLPRRLYPIYYIAGLVLAGIVGYSLVFSRRQWNMERTFLVCYSLTIFLWPEVPDPRFWLPVLPFLALEVLTAADNMRLRSGSGTAMMSRGYGSYFVLTGAFAIAYSVFLTVSQDAFVNASANVKWKPSYVEWLSHTGQPTVTGADPGIVSLLREFGASR